MLDAVRSFVLVEHSAGAMSGEPRADRRTGYQRILTPFRRPQRTKDGWIAIFPYLDEHFTTLLQAGGRHDLVGDPRLTRAGRQTNSTYVYETLESIVATRTTAQWLEFCRTERIPAAESVDLDDVIDALPERDHPVAGRYRVVPPPVRFSRSPASVRSDAPLIGQHNREVLAEVGMSMEEIENLESRGVLRTRGTADSMVPARPSDERLD